jgi:hypothetical protein
MKEKIEEILLHLDSYFEQAMGTEVTREDWVNLRKELSDLISTLIQEERKEAVEGFVKWQFNEDNPIKMQRWNIIGFSLEDMLDEVKEYLESEEK